MNKRFLAAFLCFALLLSGCSGKPGNPTTPGTTGQEDTGFGDALEDTGIYDGYFETPTEELTIEWISGTKDAYRLEGSTLIFTAVTEDTVYALSGQFQGNIRIDVGDDYKFDLELNGFAMVSTTDSPICILSGDEVAIQAKKDTQNYIYDMRPTVDENNSNQYDAAIYATVDLEIGGKGALTLVSERNQGIHTKDDLQVQNLTLTVACLDNALKGNDSVQIEGGQMTLIASAGDCIKTSNSHISDKGKQKGTITICGGTHTLYAACDGIDAAYDVRIEDSTTILNIYTDKYSNYSKEVAGNSSDSNFIRFTSNRYYYSVKYYNSEADYVWVNATYHSTVSGGRNSYYYYAYPKMPQYAKQQFFIYETEAQQGQDQVYLVMSDYLTPNTGCDTFALTSRGNQLSYTWTNYTTKIQEGGFGGPGGGFPGGPNDGNSDKGDHSTKGIKAANEIVIYDGLVNIQAYDDAIHANHDEDLENGATPLGNVTILGGTVTVYSNDDGIHADGLLSIQAGTVTVSNAYEGMEGMQVQISGGNVSIYCQDDGINATPSTGTAIAISGGNVYIYCTGDGIDANTRTADVGIVFSGGRTVVISNSGMNSALDTENGYTYTGGIVVAIMPRGGMSNEAAHCDRFTSIGKMEQISLTSGQYLLVGIGSATAAIQMPVSLSAVVVVLGDKNAKIQSAATTDLNLDPNGVGWDTTGKA